MVIAGVIIEEEKLGRLKTLGVKDSKQLLSSTRTRLSREIPGVVDDYHVMEIGAQELDHKADINYPVVSAASIMAKVHRDSRIEEMRKEYGEIGSGYAHDALTVKFLRDYYSDHGDFPPIVRRSWKTLGNIIRDLTQSTLG